MLFICTSYDVTDPAGASHVNVFDPLFPADFAKFGGAPGIAADVVNDDPVVVAVSPLGPVIVSVGVYVVLAVSALLTA